MAPLTRVTVRSIAFAIPMIGLPVKPLPAQAATACAFDTAARTVPRRIALGLTASSVDAPDSVSPAWHRIAQQVGRHFRVTGPITLPFWARPEVSDSLRFTLLMSDEPWHGRTLCGHLVNSRTDPQLGTEEDFRTHPCHECHVAIRSRPGGISHAGPRPL